MKYAQALATTFLITMGGNLVASDSIIRDTQPNYAEDDKSTIIKLHNAYQKIYEELFSYKELQNNWDGYGGIRPADEIISTTKNFIDILKDSNIINPKIMVSSIGEIGLFWKNNNSYIEIDFDENGYFTYFYNLDNKIYGEDDIALSQNIPDKLLQVLKNLKNQNTTKNSSSLIDSLDSTASNSLIV